MEIVYFTVIAIGLYFTADAILQWIERRRGGRFQAYRQLVFFAIILPLALATFWLLRLFGASG